MPDGATQPGLRCHGRPQLLLRGLRRKRAAPSRPAWPAAPCSNGVRVASPAPALATLAAVPASRVLRRTAEPARLDRAARPAAAARAVVAAQPAPAAGGNGSGGASGASGSSGRGGSGGGSGGTGGSAVCGSRACTSSELCVRPSCGGTAPRCNPLPWRPMSDRMDLRLLQHFPDTGARLRGAAVHTSRSFLHHAARVVRRHGHLRLPPGERLPDRRGMRPDQRRRSHLSVGLTKSEGTTMRELTTSNRSGFFARAGSWLRSSTLAIMIAGGCGSVNSGGGDAAAGASGQGGNAGNGASGAAGSGGASAGRGADSPAAPEAAPAATDAAQVIPSAARDRQVTVATSATASRRAPGCARPPRAHRRRGRWRNDRRRRRGGGRGWLRGTWRCWRQRRINRMRWARRRQRRISGGGGGRRPRAKRCSLSIVPARRRPIASRAPTSPTAAVTAQFVGFRISVKTASRHSRLSATRPIPAANARRDNRPPTTAPVSDSISKQA